MTRRRGVHQRVLAGLALVTGALNRLAILALLVAGPLLLLPQRPEIGLPLLAAAILAWFCLMVATARRKRCLALASGRPVVD